MSQKKGGCLSAAAAFVPSWRVSNSFWLSAARVWAVPSVFRVEVLPRLSRVVDCVPATPLTDAFGEATVFSSEPPTALSVPRLKSVRR
jgi:hypothetical protein